MYKTATAWSPHKSQQNQARSSQALITRPAWPDGIGSPISSSVDPSSCSHGTHPQPMCAQLRHRPPLNCPRPRRNVSLGTSAASGLSPSAPGSTSDGCACLRSLPGCYAPVMTNRMEGATSQARASRFRAPPGASSSRRHAWARRRRRAGCELESTCHALA